MGKCDKRVTLIVKLVLLILLILVLFFCIIDTYYKKSNINKITEFSLYAALAVLTAVIFKCIYSNHKKRSTTLLVSIGLAFTFTLCVYLANNLFHYMFMNKVVFADSNPIMPYSYFLKEDIMSTVGIGIFRYALAFIAMCAINLLVIVWFEKILPCIKKYALKIILIKSQDENNEDDV